MGISPWYVGDRGRHWRLGLQPDGDVLDTSGLVPSDFTMVFINQTDKENPRIGDGVFSDLTPAIDNEPAKITYAQSAQDVGTAGSFEIRAVKKMGTPEQETFSMGIIKMKA